MTRLVRYYPHAPYFAPFMTFLLLMLLDRVCPESWRVATYPLRSVASVYVAWMFRHHYPPLGKMHLHIAIPAGLIVAFGWVEIHHLFAGCTHDPCRSLGLFGISNSFHGFEWYRNWFLFDGKPEDYFIPSDHYHSSALIWLFLFVRIGGAAIAVPIIEEIFWRGFMLRALVDWNHFEEVPLGKFTLLSFLGTSLLSAVQHQPQWEVGILCWMVYNALFYWTRSLKCLMITHGVTNLALYVYVYHAQDWRFW